MLLSASSTPSHDPWPDRLTDLFAELVDGIHHDPARAEDPLEALANALNAVELDTIASDELTALADVLGEITGALLVRAATPEWPTEITLPNGAVRSRVAHLLNLASRIDDLAERLRPTAQKS